MSDRERDSLWEDEEPLLAVARELGFDAFDHPSGATLCEAIRELRAIPSPPAREQGPALTVPTSLLWELRGFLGACFRLMVLDDDNPPERELSGDLDRLKSALDDLLLPTLAVEDDDSLLPEPPEVER